MEDLLAELGRSGPEPGEDPKEAEEMRKAWEKMLVAGMDEKGTGLFGVDGPPANPPSAPASNALGPSAAGPSTSTTAQAKTELEFQKTIRQAMEKMKGSEEQLKVSMSFPHHTVTTKLKRSALPWRHNYRRGRRMLLILSPAS